MKNVNKCAVAVQLNSIMGQVLLLRTMVRHSVLSASEKEIFYRIASTIEAECGVIEDCCERDKE